MTEVSASPWAGEGEGRVLRTGLVPHWRLGMMMSDGLPWPSIVTLYKPAPPICATYNPSVRPCPPLTSLMKSALVTPVHSDLSLCTHFHPWPLIASCSWLDVPFRCLVPFLFHHPQQHLTQGPAEPLPRGHCSQLVGPTQTWYRLVPLSCFLALFRFLPPKHNLDRNFAFKIYVLQQSLISALG